MSKRMISLFVSLVMVMSLLPVLPAQASSINIGDYLIMGSYYDEPILWRCVDIDENGPLMLSDKIISIKPFDAAGDHSNDYNNRRLNWGSNLWETSNMRSWLNSTASAGNVNWLCGNPPTADRVWDGYNAYANEKGFLANGNFTASERNAIKTVTQKSLLNYQDRGMATSGNTTHTYHNNIANVVENYDTAYAHNVTDKMFLLDVKQVNRVYQNRSTLGNNYYIGQPTQKAVDNSSYKSSYLANGDNWYYWLRSPDAHDSSPSGVRDVYSAGYVFCSNAYSGVRGVRPAFYINLSSAIFTSGSGSVGNPYRVKGGTINDIGSFNSIEYDVLAAFANVGDNLDLLGWDLEKPGEWFGISWGLFGEEYRVISISMEFKNIVGDLDLAAFDKLENVDFKMTGINSIALPNAISEIQDGAFYDCANLTHITLPNALSHIGNDAFYNCVQLAELVLPDGLISIGKDAFRSCAGLETLTLPDAVTAIGDEAFYDCENLSSVVFMGNAPDEFGEKVFENVGDGFLVYYHEGKDGWSTPQWNGISTQPIQPPAGFYTIESLVLEDKIVRFSVVNDLNHYKNGPALLIALYGSQNKMINLHMETVTEELVDYPFDISPFDGVKTVKVFLWHSVNKLMPVSDVAYVLVESEEQGEEPDYTDVFEGEGTQVNPYKIVTANQLAILSEVVNKGVEAYNSAYYVLENDIELSGYHARNIEFNDGKGWIPIGTLDYTTEKGAFMGHFDGQGYGISNLYIHDADLERVGLFGHIQNGTVQNLGVVNVNITARQWVGGVVGSLEAFDGNANVQNCYSTGSIKGEGQVGGVAGFVYGTNGNAMIKNCYSSCAVDGAGMQIGGIVGDVLGDMGGSADMENCYSTGDVSGELMVGGVVGSLMAFDDGSARVESCYAIGLVQGAGNIGGIIGDILVYDSTVNVKNNAALNFRINGSSDVGRIVGSAETEGLTGELYTGNIAYNGLPSRTESGNDGESKGAANIRAATFFHDLFGNSNSAWVYAPNNLPILRNLKGQSSEMPSHIPSPSTGGGGSGSGEDN